MGFLPKDFKDAMSNSRYWKLKDMPQGESRFRIVQTPISGWIDWKDERPHRYRHEKRPSKSFDPDKPFKAFVSCYVWDYARKGLFVLEFTQKTIIMALDNLSDSEDWGDITGYDLKLHKEGSGQKVKYSINPVPHKPISEEIKSAVKSSPVVLEALFEAGDPWAWALSEPLRSNIHIIDDEGDGFDEIIDTKPNKGHSGSMSPIDELKEHLELDGIDTERLEDWLKLRAITKSRTIDDVVRAALDPTALAQFKRMFAKFSSAPQGVAV